MSAHELAVNLLAIPLNAWVVYSAGKAGRREEGRGKRPDWIYLMMHGFGIFTAMLVIETAAGIWGMVSA